MRQHTVARSYLARWCDPAVPPGQQPYLWIFDRSTRTGKRRSPVNVLRQSHFYTDRRATPEHQLWLEAGLGRVETMFSRAMPRIEQGRPLDRTHKLAIAAFAATAYFRTPSYQRHIRGQWSAVLDHALNLRAGLRQMTPDQIAAIPRPITELSEPSERDESLSIEAVQEIVDYPLQTTLPELTEGMLKVLMRMQCGILHTTGCPGFITSDAPCVLFDPAVWTSARRYPLGLGSRTAEVTLPLSPSFLALFGWRMDADLCYSEMPDETVDELNRRTFFHCDEQFVACQEHAREHWFDPGESPPA